MEHEVSFGEGFMHEVFLIKRWFLEWFRRSLNGESSKIVNLEGNDFKV